MDNSKVLEGIDQLKKIINENYPDVDTRKGTVIYDLLLSIGGIGYAFLDSIVGEFEKKNDLSTIDDTTDGSVVDLLMRNWFSERKAGDKSYGYIKIVVDVLKTYRIPIGTQFLANGLIYVPIEETVVLSTEIVTDENSNKYFIVHVQADTVGNRSVVEGSIFATTLYPLNIQSITAFSDFYPGSTEETNTNFINRTKDVISTRDMVSARSIGSLFSTEFPTITDHIVLGKQDKEMIRDQNALGVKMGGKIDILINSKIETADVSITTDVDGKAEIPLKPITKVNYYYNKNYPSMRIEDIDLEFDSAEYKISPLCARFSSYEKLTLVTPYPSTDIVVSVDYNPLVESVQGTIDQSDYKNLTGDTVVKTFMPAYIYGSINAIVDKDIIGSVNSDGVTISEDYIAEMIINNVVEYVQSYKGITFKLSSLVSYLHKNIEEISSIELPIGLLAEYYLPDISSIVAEGPSEFHIPYYYDLGVSDRTYRFYIKSTDLNVLVTGE